MFEDARGLSNCFSGVLYSLGVLHICTITFTLALNLFIKCMSLQNK